ncbi:MAG: ADP-ribosylation factor-like protein [Promethearchaeota archaeon]
MYHLVLSRFDCKIGPKVFLNVPELPNKDLLDKIPRLMDIYEEMFFIHELDEFKTTNLVFTIPSPIARGGQETLMISIIILNNEEADPKIFKEVLEQFVHELKKREEIYRGFYREDKNFEDNQEMYEIIKDLLNSVYFSLPKETFFVKARDINLIIFDFFTSDESPTMKIIDNFISIGQFYNKISRESNLLNRKLSISEYSLYHLMNFSDFFLFQLKNKDGFIFVVDITNRKMIKRAKRIFNKISNFPEISSMPLLVLINDIGVYQPKIRKFIKDLSIIEDDNKTVKYIPNNPVKNGEIHEAFSWIVDRIY